MMDGTTLAEGSPDIRKHALRGRTAPASLEDAFLSITEHEEGGEEA
ncbi:MAG: hypothetical protein ACLT8E_04355 [Akkermansia sp.]